MNGSLQATTSMNQAAEVAWDAIVIGAGPAGSVAAHGLARQGLRTLLIDRVALPRAKVCGCCVAPGGARTLEALGLGEALNGASPLTWLRLVTKRRSATTPLRDYLSIGRDVLDLRLASMAHAAGAELLWPASAQVVASGRVRVTQGQAELDLSASVLVAADGLGGSSLRCADGPDWQIHRRSRMGAGAVLDQAPLNMRFGEIAMLCERSGYLGIVRLPDGRYDAAAAFEPRAVRSAGGPASLAADFLRRAHGNPQAALAARWKATGLLTRRRTQVENERLLLVGDAAGYVEPITGEGITWAIESGAECVRHAVAIARGSTAPGAWTRAHARLLDSRRRRCALVAEALRTPLLVSFAQLAMSGYPSFAGAIVQRFSAPAAPGMAATL